ncbi:hypothetical protein [Streptomyces violaceusniger]|uniref:hypothetical protein n=1 Tax=Streptomyces violaceusniger TaxID=68280 RepID=UPI003810D6DA
MATPTLSIQSLPDDLVTLKEASVLLRPTPRPASVSTITRWIARYHITVFQRGKSHAVSFTDVLIAQRDEAIRLRSAH